MKLLVRRGIICVCVREREAARVWQVSSYTARTLSSTLPLPFLSNIWNTSMSAFSFASPPMAAC